MMNLLVNNQHHASRNALVSMAEWRHLVMVGWLVFNSTFNTKRLHHAMQKSKSLLKILISDKK